MTEKIIDFIRFMENKVNPEQNIIEIDLIAEKGIKVNIPSSHILISSNSDNNIKIPIERKPVIFYADNERSLKSASKEGSHYKKVQSKKQCIEVTEEFEITEKNNDLNNQSLNKNNEKKKVKNISLQKNKKLF